MFVTLTTIIASANMFGQAFIMTNGAPARETRTAIFYIAETGLQDFQMGEAAAASWILTVALMLLSLVVFGVFRAAGECRVMRRIVQYVVLLALTLLFVSPLLLMLVTSFKSPAEASQTPPSWLPNPFTFQAYERIFGAADTPVLRWFMNSMLAASANAVLVVVTRRSRRTPSPGWTSAARRSCSG